MHVGIDLGTTFSCITTIDETGKPVVIASSAREQTTPSVIWFDGRQAFVGKEANLRKQLSGDHIYEFVKADMGKPVELLPGSEDVNGAPFVALAPFEIGGFKYGAAGMSAIILRKLKIEALRYFKRIGSIPKDTKEQEFELDAVITVPAYVGTRERENTAIAGYAAGLNVIDIINEPAAAALAYGLVQPQNQRIMVFDLGGGTCDVTILSMANGSATELSKEGNHSLGGRFWDELILNHLYDAFSRVNGRSYSVDDTRKVFLLQELALQAKHALSESLETTVTLEVDEGSLDETLLRNAPPGRGLAIGSSDPAFHLDRRSSQLLHKCRLLCESALAKATVQTPGGTRPMSWDDLDDIVLAGGACRMPIVPEMLERISGKRILRRIDGFDYDTAIAIGAALHGQRSRRVNAVASHSIGVKLLRNGREVIERLISKNTPVPTTPPRRNVWPAHAHARVEVYEGESESPDECVALGLLVLENTTPQVAIEMEIDKDGILRVTAEYPPDGRQSMELKYESGAKNARADELRKRIQSLQVNL